MSPERGIDEEHEALMIGLIFMLAESAWTSLGKRVNPVTGKEEVSLPAARAMIDTLGALKERTSGNLKDRERSLLENQLTNLRLNYVEVLKAEQSQKPEEPASGVAGG